MSAKRPWLYCLQPNEEANLRLLCLPYAGGGMHVFSQWPKRLPATVEVWAGHFPGRGRRFSEPPVTEMAPAVAAVAGTVAGWTVPWLIFGHSLGALVGFEIARLLRRWRSDTHLVGLLVSACRAPQRPLGREPIADLPEAAFLAALNRLGGTPEEVLANEELVELLLPALRADFGLAERYHYMEEPPLSCPIFAFGGQQDPEVSLTALTGWQYQTTAEFELRLFPGGHFYVNHMLDTLLSVIGHLLEKLSRDLKES